MKTIAFFNNKGGVGKTSLVYHLAWMFSELETSVVIADLDPQANLTAMFLNEERLEEIWPDSEHPETVYGSVTPIVKGIGDIASPHVEMVGNRIGLIPGDLALSRFEDKLSSAWPDCLDRDEAAFRISSSFYRIIQNAAQQCDASLGLIDVGPNLGAINRTALLGADYVVVPLAADLFSLQGLRNLGPTLNQWRSGWKDRVDRKPEEMEVDLPSGSIEPIGYIVMQHATRLDRPVKAYKRWTDRIPTEYRKSVLRKSTGTNKQVSEDPNCLASLKNYRSLMPYAQDALKPMFFLKPADGALGGHMAAVQSCYNDFHDLASVILDRID
ncbi:MAG: ParA family protein [Planctomycetaceae bacterium]|nr:ParA family protein [Planctomycetaceae bacterium]